MKHKTFFNKTFLLIGFILFSKLLNAQTIVNVSTSAELVTALSKAVAGQTIVLTGTTYVLSSGFKAPIGVNGTSTNPITLKSTTNASLSTGSISSGYAFYLPKNDYWVIDGIKVTTSKKGIMLDNSNFNLIKNVTVDNIGEEGIHIRTFSTYNTVQNCFIDNTGIYTPGYGEGIYFGSAYSNWSTYTSGNPDTCDYNIAEYNSFGDHVAAENIDIKEGTQYGTIRGNIFNGKGLTNANSADSFIDLKGNYYLLECNSGTNAMTDGIQSHIVYTGYGNYNTLRNNSFDVGNTNGYAINIATSSSSGSATGNLVCTNNTYTNAKALTNITATSCSATTCSTLAVKANNLTPSSNYSFYPNPVSTELTINSLVGFHNAIIIIYNALGKEVKKLTNINENNIVINKNNLSSGVYYITITEGNSILAKQKILVN